MSRYLPTPPHIEFSPVIEQYASSVKDFKDAVRWYAIGMALDNSDFMKALEDAFCVKNYETLSRYSCGYDMGIFDVRLYQPHGVLRSDVQEVEDFILQAEKLRKKWLEWHQDQLNKLSDEEKSLLRVQCSDKSLQERRQFERNAIKMIDEAYDV